MKKFLLSLFVLFLSFGNNIGLAFAENQSQSVSLSFSHLLTNKTSPELRGDISSTANLIVIVKVEGCGEIATDMFENNQWVLSEDSIQPSLQNGTYDIYLEAKDYDGNVLGQFFLGDGIEVNDQYVSTPKVELLSPADQGNEKNFEVLAKAEPEQAIEVKISDGLNASIEYSELTDLDGTMRHSFDISGLWDGEIKISTIATNIYNGAQSSEVIKIIDKNSATLSLPTVLSSDVITSQNMGNFSITGRGASNSTLYYYFFDQHGNISTGSGNIGGTPYYKLYTDLSDFSDGDVNVLVGLKNSSGATSKLVEHIVPKDTTGPKIYNFEADPYINKDNASNFHIKAITEPNSETMIVGSEGLTPVYIRKQADSNGLLDFNMDFSELLDGEISIYLNTYDQYENSEQKNVKVSKDTLSPEPPQISGNLTNINSSSNCIRSMTGSAEANSKVEYKIFNGDIEKISGQIDTDEQGKFVLDGIDFTNFSNGSVKISLTNIDSLSNESEPTVVAFEKNIIAIAADTDTSEIDESSGDTNVSDESDIAQLISTNTNIAAASTSETLPLAGPDWFKLEFLILIVSYSFWKIFLFFNLKKI
ncbi:MAG: hypothetical protein WC536_03965 [Patescibacteria group bacterium]